MACNGALGRLGKLYVKGSAEDTSDVTWDDVGFTDASYRLVMDDAAWVEVCAVDVDTDGAKEKIDTSDRCSGTYKAYVPGQAEGTISFKAFKRKPIATGSWLDILRTAYYADSTVSCMMLDDDAGNQGADGILANVNVFNMSESQPLNGPIEINFELAISGCVAYSPPARPITRPDDP